MLSANILTIITFMKYFLCGFIYLFLAFFAHAAEEEAIEGSTAAASTAQSSTPSAPPIPRTEPDSDLNRIKELLKSHTPDTEVVQLKTGSEDEELLAFYQFPGAPVVHGGILMLPDQAAHLDWPDNLAYLRTGLSDYGWHTLSLLLPTPERKALPKRTLPVLTAIKPPTQEGEEGSEETETDAEANESSTEGEAVTENNPTEEPAPASKSPAEDTKDQKQAKPFNEVVNRYTASGIKHLQEKSAKRLIILGIGTGATWAAQFTEQNQDKFDLRLVMIDAKQPKTPNSPNLLEILPKIKTTIIDLYHSPRISHENNEQLHQAKKRLRIARSKIMNNFHQSRLPATNENWKKDQHWMLKQVRGLINTYIIKAEKSKRGINTNSPNRAGEKAPG